MIVFGTDINAYDVAFLRLKRPFPGVRPLPLQIATPDIWSVVSRDEQLSPYLREDVCSETVLGIEFSIASATGVVIVGYGTGGGSFLEAEYGPEPIGDVQPIANREAISLNDGIHFIRGWQKIKARLITGGIFLFPWAAFPIFTNEPEGDTHALSLFDHLLPVQAPDGTIHHVPAIIRSRDQIRVTPGDSGSPIIWDERIIAVVSRHAGMGFGYFSDGTLLTPDALSRAAAAFSDVVAVAELPVAEAAEAFLNE